jgi:hypothetical protein
MNQYNMGLYNSGVASSNSTVGTIGSVAAAVAMAM